MTSASCAHTCSNRWKLAICTPDTLHGAADALGVEQAAPEGGRGQRSAVPGQRNHDALEVLLDFVLTHGGLGDTNKLSSQMVITADLADIAAGAGVALTANGTRQVRYLGRGRRLASRAPLFGRDRGCTVPGCDQAFSRIQAHHMPDWQHGGPTDILFLPTAS